MIYFNQIMTNPSIITLDLNFQDTPSVIAAYLLPHADGAALIESGPGSTWNNLVLELEKHGYTPEAISDVFLTHIHLDHAGAAGHLAKYGAVIHVHPIGAPHLINPERLLASAARIYGDDMERLWGKFLPVPANQLSSLSDGQTVDVHGLQIFALDTPGHANHHLTYLFNNVCFCGDIGGVRLGDSPAIRVPMPPPEFQLEKWRNSLEKIASLPIQAIAPTHFGIYTDPSSHLSKLKLELEYIEQWIKANLNPSNEVMELRKKFLDWSESLNKRDNLDLKIRYALELANPAFMSADGILRYWKKFRQPKL